MRGDHHYRDELLSRQQMSEIAFSAAIGAALMLFAGFYLNMRGIGDSAFYNLSVNGFTWMMKIGGGLMGLVALLLWAGVRPVLAADAVLTLGIGGLMIAIGGVWLVNGDFEGLLLLIFAAVFIRSGWGSWIVYRGLGPGAIAPIADEDEPSSTPPQVVAVDPSTRQAAMDRLLASKKREGSTGAGPEQKEATPASTTARPVVAERQPIGVEREAPAESPPPSPEPEPAQRSASEQPPSPDEPTPDGFLAQLGRDDAKRK
jgi:hypothetical protein